MDKQKRIKIYSLSVGVFVLIVTIIVLLARSHGGPDDEICTPRSEMPVLDMSRAKKVHSSDNKILVNSAAYINLYDAGYIQLNPKSVSDKPDDTKLFGLLTLENDCADVKFDYFNINGQMMFWNVQWTLRNKLSTTNYVCQGTNFDHSFKTIERFSCLGRLVQRCKVHGHDRQGNNYSQPVGEMVFEALEIEYDGDPEKIKRGEFSKDPAPGGCGYGLD